MQNKIMAGKPTASKPKGKFGATLNYFNNNKYLYFMMAIPIAFYIIFAYLPMFGLVIAFKNYNMFQGFFSGDWVGLDVFKEIFKMNDFWASVRNTLGLNVLSVIVSFPCPIILALMINELKNILVKRTIQSVVYLPYFLSWMIIGGMLLEIFSEKYGIVNHLITMFGAHPIPFLTNEGWWVVTFIGALIWQSAGYNSIIYLAAITGVNPELYEAAKMDGCNKFQQIIHVTLPCIRQTIVIMLILAVGGVMSIGFDRSYSLQNPIVMNVADTISTYVYRTGISNARYSVATAVGLFQSVLSLILVSFANYTSKKFGEEGLW